MNCILTTLKRMKDSYTGEKHRKMKSFKLISFLLPLMIHMEVTVTN